MTSTSYYIGPNEGRLDLPSWDSVVVAAAAGLLDESYWVELKKDVPPTSAGSNMELARDIASLSVDGGLLIIGIKDDKGRAGDVVGIADPSALSDRIVQVARTIHPPVQVEVQRLPSPDGSTTTLVVRVPASATAPHMVDHRYWGRSDHGKTPLSDPEVARLFDLRRSRQEDFVDQMREAQSRDLVALQDRTRGHGYVVMRPLGYQDAPGQQVAVTSLASTVRTALGAVSPQWSPAMDQVSSDRPHPDGLLTTSNQWEHDSPTFGHVQVLFLDTGQVEVVSTEITTTGMGHDPEAPQFVPIGHVIELVHCSMLVAGHIGEHHLGYQGQWQVGVILDGLKGVRTSKSATSRGYVTPPFPSQEYVRTAMTTTTQLRDNPATVTDQLLRPFVRGLGHERTYLPYADLADMYASHRRSQQS